MEMLRQRSGYEDASSPLRPPNILKKGKTVPVPRIQMIRAPTIIKKMVARGLDPDHPVLNHIRRILWEDTVSLNIVFNIFRFFRFAPFRPPLRAVSKIFK